MEHKKTLNFLNEPNDSKLWQGNWALSMIMQTLM